MLLQLSVENYKSINEQIIFSMIATPDSLHQNYIHDVGNYHVLPTSLIVGTNGAGKSNLFRVISYLQDLLLNNEIKVYPHKLNKDDYPTKIDIQFTIDNKRIIYGIDVLDNNVKCEFLVQIDNNAEEIIFERNDEDYQFHPRFKALFNQVNIECKKDKLFLPLLNQQNIELINKCFQYLTGDIKVIISDTINTSDYFNEAVKVFKTNGNKVINNLFKDINIGVKGFFLNKDEIMVKYENLEINLAEEATGMKKLFTLLVLLSKALDEGSVVLFDELENNLHQAFLLYFISLFNNPSKNKNNAQLIFSAHHTPLLDLGIFRKDQIWFMDKNLKSMSTICYSLADIKDVRETENIERGYRLGKYGATFSYKHGGVIKDEE